MYLEYSRQIEKEYGHMERNAFRHGRSRVLHALGEGQIYFSVLFQREFREQARINMAEEIARLEAAT